jgi:hypothetical protein
MLGLGLGSEDGDYGHPNFFGNISYDLADRFGVFLQAASTRFGRGRVLLFTDSTCFSNFCMFSPGTPELALRLVGFLCRSMPDNVRNPSAVLVDTTHSRAYFFQYMDAGRRPSWQHFEELYLSLVRCGMRPSAGDLDDMDAGSAKSMIIVNPVGPFSRAEVEGIVAFVSDGGSLLVLDGILNSPSAANDVLRVFGMGILVRPIAGGGSGRARPAPALEIVGGEIAATDSTGRVVAATVAFGEGEVVVAVDSYAYSEAGLGRPLQPAGTYERRIPTYRTLFDLMSRLR